jgi:hypothetical protein
MIIVARTKEGAESEYAKSKGKGGRNEQRKLQRRVSSRMIAIREILNRIFVVPLNGENWTYLNCEYVNSEIVRSWWKGSACERSQASWARYHPPSFPLNLLTFYNTLSKISWKLVIIQLPTNFRQCVERVNKKKTHQDRVRSFSLTRSLTISKVRYKHACHVLTRSVAFSF